MARVNATRALVRRFLDAILRSDDDLNKFLLDHFPEIQRTVGSGQNRLSKTNLLLEAAACAEIWDVLVRAYDAENPKYAHLLRGVGQEPEWVSRRLKCRAELETLQAARVILFRNHDDCSSIDKRIIEVKRNLRADEMLAEEDVLGDRYHLLSKISQGGFAVVWLARDLESHFPKSDPRGLVALKILHQRHLDSGEQLDRFERGAKAMRQLALLRHPPVPFAKAEATSVGV